MQPKMIKDFVSDIIFALSKKPTECRRQHLKTLVEANDHERAKGVMFSINRNNILIQHEEIYLEDLKSK